MSKTMGVRQSLRTRESWVESIETDDSLTTSTAIITVSAFFRLDIANYASIAKAMFFVGWSYWIRRLDAVRETGKAPRYHWCIWLVGSLGGGGVCSFAAHELLLDVHSHRIRDIRGIHAP